MTINTGIKKHSITLGLSLLLLCLGQNNARALNLPDVPLTVFSSAEHNVLLTFDDSGSMARGYLPDGLSGAAKRHCANNINGIAFNPAVTYTPPPVRDTSGSMPATTLNLPSMTNFTAVSLNGFLSGAATINLSTSYQPVWEMNVNLGTAGTGSTSANDSVVTCNSGGAQAAYYYVYDTSLAGTGGCPSTPVTTDDDCYRKVVVSATSGPGGTSEFENFANWYSYYRVRNLAAKSAAGRAFRGFDTNVRIAGQHLNNSSATAGPAAGITFTNTTSTNTTNVMKRFCDDPFSTDSLCIDLSNARTAFFTRLYNSPAANATPLRTAMQRAGNSFGSGNTGQYSPYRTVPGAGVSAANPELSCRKNFHVMMTDGYWNDSTSTITDRDSSSRTLGDGTAYTPIPPYREVPTRSSTLADYAFEYWYKDLRTDLANNVKASERDTTGTASQRYWNPRNNPAVWQHMQTFTVGLGLTGTRNPANYFDTSLPASAGDWDELKSGALSWPNPLDAEDGDRIDDLWHAALNGRGDYYAASNPSQLVTAFTQIIGQINQISGSAAGLGATGSSTTTSSGAASIFQVGYNTGTWAGLLMSKRVDADGAPDLVNWEGAYDGLNTQHYSTDRHIFTFNPTNTGVNRGVRFRWADLSATQQAALNKDLTNVTDSNGSARLDYLRGASVNEGTGLGFRVRACYPRSTLVTDFSDSTIPCTANVGKLGDIIDSSPVYVGKPNFGYPDTIEAGVANKYSTFVTAKASREAMIYVGANDGMLHGFSNVDGKEKMAYVPNLVYSNITQNNLSLLTSPLYSHRYYVNGTPTAGDVFFGGAWHTMLVGGLRKGGKGYFALDVTNPANFTESGTNAQTLVKWEFPDPADPANPAPDMGFSYSQPTIFKMANNKWAAIFGNGYNSSTGRAMIFIVDIETGLTIQKIDTGVSGGGGSPANPNGMATPAVVDLNDDYIADYIYAGDLLGKMWRIDVRSATPANWALASNVAPLFTAVDPLNAAQPITTQPSVGHHPMGFGGLMVYFGTGKYLENNDNATIGTQQIQSFYGIYDRGVTGRSTEPSRREPAGSVVRADLLQQTIDTTVGAVGTFSTRNISDNAINWRLDRVSTTTHLGWYVNLPGNPSNPANGERQVTDSLLREGRIVFTTMIPNPDACNPGGTGWLMVLNLENGGRLKETFDADGDSIFTAADNSGQTYGAAGAMPTGGGSLSTPIVLTNPPGAPGTNPPCKETVESVDSNGVILPMKITCKPSARESWRQLR